MTTPGGACTSCSATTSSVLGTPASIIGSELPWLTGSGPSLCPAPMPQSQAAPAFAQWGTPPERVPHSPPSFHHSPSTLSSQAPLCEKPLILRTGFGHLVI